MSVWILYLLFSAIVATVSLTWDRDVYTDDLRKEFSESYLRALHFAIAFVTAPYFLLLMVGDFITLWRRKEVWQHYDDAGNEVGPEFDTEEAADKWAEVNQVEVK